MPDTDPTDPTGTEAEADRHRAQAVACHNATWDLLTRTDRTPDDDEDMLRTVYASAYHWARAARRGPENEARARYMQSKVWHALGDGAMALHYADRCMQTTVAAGLVDFDLAYAHEARARALHALGRTDEAAAAYTVAQQVPIADDEDRAIVEADLATFP
jgi:tetratricopeptide (TPR) repeat protein